MKKSLIVGGIFSLIIIALGVYFLMRSHNGNDLIAEKNRLQSDLAIAQKKLIKERNTLEIMKSDLKNSFALAGSVQDQMEKGSNIVSQTDFMFTDPNGLNPELILKNFPTILLINKERHDINLILAEWKNKTNISFINKIDKKEAEQIKKDAEMIKKYLKDLSQLVSILTPQNSGISQFQIYVYLSSLPSEGAINEVLVSLQNAIDNSQNNNSETLNNQTPSGSSPDVHVFTSEDIATQQGIVSQTEAQVTALQEQLVQVENQIQQSSAPTTSSNSDANSNSSSASNTTSNPSDTTSTPPSPSPNSDTTSTPTSSTIQNNTNSQTNSDSSTQNTNSIESTESTPASSSNDSVRVFDKSKYQGIIIQPGPPQLIQGDNQY